MDIIHRAVNQIRRALNADAEPLDRARMHILFYVLSGNAVFTALLIGVYAVSGPPLQLYRIIAVFLLLSYGLYKMIVDHNYKPAAHLVILILNALVWSNIFVVIHAINIVTIQYILLVITCSFYLLNGRAGMIYSFIVMCPVILHFLLSGTDNIQVSVNSQQVSDPVFVTVMMFNFFMLIFINYHFLRAFHFAINLLKESQNDEKLLNEKLKKSISITEASSKAKSDFLSTMSHELRTPLNSVIGMSYVLLADNPREDQKENLKILYFSAGSLLSLINDILDFNKLEYEKLHLEQIAFKPAELITSIHAGLKFQAEEKGLDFILDMEEKLETIVLIGDPTRLLQILFNLVGNAIKFTTKGSVRLTVEALNPADSEIDLSIAVQDTGIGISESQLDIIFEPFSQGSTDTTRKFGGTGLGLAITKQLLSLHNGEMSISSEVGAGTIFKFKIKYKRASADEVVEKKHTLYQQADLAELSELRIMVAEDNAMNVLLLKKLFSSWNITADFAANGLEAVEKATGAHYDVILMDIHMPVMDGYEATKRILKFYDDCIDKPLIIALTASVSENINTKVAAAGLSDYISKPFNPLELKSKLGSIVGNRLQKQG